MEDSLNYHKHLSIARKKGKRGILPVKEECPFLYPFLSA